MAFTWGSALRITLLILLVAAVVTACFTLPVEKILKDFLTWVDQDLGPWGPLVLAVAYIPLTILAVPASVLTLGGGYLFGLPVGFVADSIGATIGAGAAFLLGRTIGKPFVISKLKDYPEASSPSLQISSGFSDKMSRVYVGNLDSRVSERDLEDEFRVFGVIRSVWVARRPPGYAFIDFDDYRDAQDAIRELDGKNGWRVELSHNSRGGGGGRGGGRGRSGGSDLKCYECGEPGHFARECRLRGGSGRRRSRSPRYRRSPSYGRRSYSPRGRSPRRRSVSPRGRSYSRSPPYRGREELPYANGNGARDRRRSRS